jgi:hypothetical protein
MQGAHDDGGARKSVHAESEIASERTEPQDADLAKIAAAWPKLPESLQAAILAIIGTAG